MKYFNFRNLAFTVLIFAVLYYVVFFSVYTIILQEIFDTFAFDAGIDDQGIWLLSRFMNPFVTVRGLNLFADSMTLYHLLAAPFFWLWDNINILYILQTLFIAAGALPLFYYARERLQSGFLALSIALSFLLYPALQNMNLDQYHSEVFAVLFMIMTLFFLMKNNFTLYHVFFILTIMGKDEIALTGIFLGLFLFFFKQQPRHGLITIGISLAWFLVCSKILVPIFAGVGLSSPRPLVYSHWFQEMMGNLLNPAYYWNSFTRWQSLRYYFRLLAPAAFMPLAGYQILFLIIPSVAVNVLSGTDYLISIEYHYDYVQTAVIFFAMIEGVHLLKERLARRRWPEKEIALLLGAVILVSAYVFNNHLSRLPFNSHWTSLRNKLEILNSPKIRFKQEAVRLIPKKAKVSASYSFVPHLSHRKEIYMFPNPFKASYWNFWFREGRDLPPPKGHVDYVIIDFNNHGEEERSIVHYLTSSSSFEKIFQKSDFLVLKNKDHAEDADR